MELGKTYYGVSLRVVESGGLSHVWENVTGAFFVEDVPDWEGGMVSGPVFRREFPSGQVVTLGMQTPSRTIWYSVDGVFAHPSTLHAYAPRVWWECP